MSCSSFNSFKKAISLDICFSKCSNFNFDSILIIQIGEAVIIVEKKKQVTTNLLANRFRHLKAQVQTTVLLAKANDNDLEEGDK